MSFPSRFLLRKNLLVGDVLDFGCGFGMDVDSLKSAGISIEGYDKHYFPNYPIKKFDTIICLYVLNVLLPEEQASVLMEISQLVKPSGKVYFAVRRDLQFEGFRTHKLHRKPTYQCNVSLTYNSIYKNESCEIYEYRHFNQQKIESNCPFCGLDSDAELIVESATALAFFDKFPVSKGHALIIPKRHCGNYFDLTFKEQSACLFMLNRVQQIIKERFNPDGFNIGINVNEYAGQTVYHAHVHLIPRYKGDISDPRGGVRGVIPEFRVY